MFFSSVNDLRLTKQANVWSKFPMSFQLEARGRNYVEIEGQRKRGIETIKKFYKELKNIERKAKVDASE